MSVHLEFYSNWPAPMVFTDAKTAFHEIRARQLAVKSLTINVHPSESMVTNNVHALLHEVTPLVEHLSFRIMPPNGRICAYPVLKIIPNSFRMLNTLKIDGLSPSGLNGGAFDKLEKLELRASCPLVPCTSLHALLMGVGNWRCLKELRLHHYMRVIAIDMLPTVVANPPIVLPGSLESIILEDTPDAVHYLLTNLIIPPGASLHLIASCPSFPVDVSPLFQMLTTTPYVEFSRAPYKVDLPILRHASIVRVDFKDNLEITGSTSLRKGIVLEIRAPPPLQGGLASRPALLSAAIRRLPELFDNGLGPAQQSVAKLIVHGDISQVGTEDWRHPLGRFGALCFFHVVDRSLANPSAVLDALCDSWEGDIVCPSLDFFVMDGFPYKDEDSFVDLLYALQTRARNRCDLANLRLRCHWDPPYPGASGQEVKDRLVEGLYYASPNTNVEVSLSLDGLGVFGGVPS